jgi:hypothetical protein
VVSSRQSDRATRGLTWDPRGSPHRPRSGACFAPPDPPAAYGLPPQVKPGVAPDEAAALGNNVLATSEILTGSVIQRLTQLRDSLRPWVRTPEVALFTDQVGAWERLVRA